MIGQRLLGALMGALVLTAGGSAIAQTRADLIPLGRSAASGAVCEAVRDYDDPVVQAAGRRAWSIRCRGWETSLGRLYTLPGATAEQAWSQALTRRADCAEARSQALDGLGAVTRRACRHTTSKAAYLSYQARRSGALYTAEGASQIADILETGLRVVSGVARAPQAADVQVSAASAEIAADFGGAAGGLARAQAAAAADPARLRARAYVQNNEWRFDLAETDFQALVTNAEARNAPPKELGEAMLNLALNISNNGRFAEADHLFGQAAAQVARANDPVLEAQALGYQALHLRNQGRFEEAVAAGRQALLARERVRAARKAAGDHPEAAVTPSGAIAIGGDLSQALNTRAAGASLLGGRGGASVSDQLLVQDAQALEVIGSSLAAQGDLAGARQALNRAAATLAVGESNGALNIGLRARVEADLAEIDLDEGHAAQAADRLGGAIQLLRRRHAGASTEGGLLLALGRAQVAAGREEAALASFDRAFHVFQGQRGSLGASADAAAPYFDLLLDRIQSDPGKADDYRARFFNAAESVVSNATAQTVSKLAARVASGDGAITGLVRALDDTRRELRAAEARAATLEQQGADAGERAALHARLAALQQQSDALESQLLAANPRYAQLVSSEASLADLQKALRPAEVYVKVVLLEDRGYGVLVSKDAARPYAISLSRGQAAREIHALRAPFEELEVLPEFDVARAHRMFLSLFGPIRSDLAAARHLIYEPDGALISLPVATLVTDDPAESLARRTATNEPDYRLVKWLGASLDSSLVLSASSFLQSRAFTPSQAKQNFLAFADPKTPRSGQRAFASILRRGGASAAVSVCEGARQALMNLSDLPDTAEEVRKVSASFGGRREDLMLGGAFTDDAVKARTDLADYKVLYFATHGLLPQPSGCLPEPALVTSLGDGDSDGLLDSSEILDLKLDADLVVLSACDTGGPGAGSADGSGLQGGGEALGGLTRAVIYAGGRALVVSHWSIDSTATVRLMTGLFDSTAPSEAEALQQAQGALQQSTDWSHPYFWAPFTIIGDGSRPLPNATKTGL